MDLSLLLTLLDLKRIPNYLVSIIYAKRHKLLSFKREFRGMLSLPEGVALHRLAKSLPNDSIMLEIGCYGGLSSAFLSAGAKNKAFLYSVDPFDTELGKQKEGIKKYQDKEYGEIELIHISSKPSKKEVERQLRKNGIRNFELIAGYSHDVVRQWQKKIDLLWIDGNHEYAAVRKDFLDWTPLLLKKEGVVVFHDANKRGKSKRWEWGWEGPTRVVKEFIKPPKWKNKTVIDSLVYAIKNF